MNNLYMSLIMAAGITFLAVVTRPKDPNTTPSSYGFKIYAISFIVCFLSLTYLGSDQCIKQVIETGDADF